MSEGSDNNYVQIAAVEKFAKEVYSSWEAAKYVDLESVGQSESVGWKRYYILVSFLSAALSIAEAIIVGYPSSKGQLYAQVAILSMSSSLYCVSIALVAAVINPQSLSNSSHSPRPQSLELQSLPVKSVPPPNWYIVAIFQRSTLFEGGCLIVGWACIFVARGLAAVRCFRVFCVLQAVDMIIDLQKDKNSGGQAEKNGESSGWTYKSLLDHSADIVDLSLKYLKRIHEELFTAKSRGGTVVLTIFFYTSYIIAVVMYRDRSLFENYVDPTNLQDGDLVNVNVTSLDPHCVNLRACWINTLRLPFYDGNGFDLLSNVLYAKAWHLFLLLIVYMVFTAIILLNGLTGIFGRAFDEDEKAPNKPQVDEPWSRIQRDLNSCKEIVERWSNCSTLNHSSLDVRGVVGAAAQNPIGSQPKDKGRGKKRITEDWKGNKWVKAYFAFCFLLSLAEAILVGCPEGDAQQVALWAILALASALFLFGLWLMTVIVKDFETDGSILGVIWSCLRALMEPAAQFEFVCLLIGWVCMSRNPGFACLRCFRIFRILWNFELYDVTYDSETTTMQDDQASGGSQDFLKMSGRLLHHFVDLFFRHFSHICHLSLRYFKKLGRELFTSKSRGGVIVLILFFYVTYIVAVIFWQDKGVFDVVDPTFNISAAVPVNEASAPQGACGTLAACWLTMLRLSMYDGNGFNFLASVMYSGSWWLTAVLIAYMCFTAIVLLNGLIGIFGHAFELKEKSTDDPAAPEKKQPPGASAATDAAAALGTPGNLPLTLEQENALRDLHAKLSHLLSLLSSPPRAAPHSSAAPTPRADRGAAPAESYTHYPSQNASPPNLNGAY